MSDVRCPACRCDGVHSQGCPEVPGHDPVNAPSWYTTHPSGVECLDVVRHMTFTVGNAVKYVWRHEGKNGVEDLRKAAFYLRDALDSGDRLFTSLWSRNAATPLIDKVLVWETGLRHGFFNALTDLDLEWALECVTEMIDRASLTPVTYMDRS